MVEKKWGRGDGKGKKKDCMEGERKDLQEWGSKSPEASWGGGDGGPITGSLI